MVETKSKVPEWIGKTPFPPDKKRVTRIERDMIVTFLYGFEGNQLQNLAYACTDKIFMAEWILPPGAHYEPAGYHLHGDECYYILEGEPVAFNAETGETHQLHPGDALLIPQASDL